MSSSNVAETRREVQQLTGELRQLLRYLDLTNISAAGALGLLAQMGLPPEVEQQIRILQQLILTLQAVRAAAIAAEISLGPVGWIIAGVGFVGGFAIMELARREREW